MKKFLTAALVAAMALINGAPTASAQTTTLVCEGGSVPVCVCPDGFHPQNRSEPPSATNPCVANVTSGGGSGSGSGSGSTGYPDVCDPELLGTESNGRGGCRCTAENREAGAIGTVPVAITYADRRAHGLPTHGYARGCFRLVDGEVTPGPHGDWSIWRDGVDQAIAGLRAALIAICSPNVAEVASAEEVAAGPTWEELLELCEQTRARIDGLNPADSNVDQRIAEIDGQIVDLGDQIEALDQRVGVLEAHDADHERRITGLESTLRGFARSVHIRLGGFGRLGGMLHGPMTGAGGASVELLFRFGDLPVGLYGRFLFGGQSTGWDVGDSMYVGGGAGLTAFTGGRDDTTFSLGWHADTLLDPYVRDHRFDHDSLGVYNGLLLSTSIPIPGAPAVRIYLGLDAGLAERRMIDSQGTYHVIQDVAVSGTVGLEVQIPSFM